MPDRRLLVKICGITNLSDAVSAVASGCDFLGFVFAPGPRQVSPELVRDILAELPENSAKIAGVFVDDDVRNVNEVASYLRLDYVQLHGSESPGYCRLMSKPVIKAFRLRDESSARGIPSYGCELNLIEPFVEGKSGGTGVLLDPGIARKAVAYGKILLAGGLAPENVGRVVREIFPYGVDVSSGVEKSPGLKDAGKMRDFVREVRKAEKDGEE